MSGEGIHYVDFCSDAREAICGWEPPEDYAGTTIFLSAATCPACRALIDAKVEALRPRVDAAGEGSRQTPDSPAPQALALGVCA